VLIKIIFGKKHPVASRLILATVFLLFCNLVFPQASIGIGLEKQIQSATSDSQRVRLLGELCRFYYATRDFAIGDSLFEKQIMLAESSLNDELVLAAYFSNTAFLVSSSETKERSKIIMGYVKRGFDFAKSNDRPDYMALGYAQMAAMNISDGNLEEAFKNASLGFSGSLSNTTDSVKVITAIQLGKVYQEKADVVNAFKVFTNAQNVAIESNNPSLLPAVYHAMANLYKKLGKEEDAKKYVNKSMAIHKTLNDIPGQVNDLIFLAKLSNYTAGKMYLQEALHLAESINNVPLKIDAERILFSHMLLKEKPETMLAFLEQRTELSRMFENTGPSYPDWMSGEIFLYAGAPDTALTFFKKAEPAFNSGYDLTARKNFFVELAYCYQQLKNIPLAISYYERSLELSKLSGDLRAAKSNTNELKKLNEEKGDFAAAYKYGVMYDQYRDQVDQLGKERDLALLEIDNVKKQQQRDEELAKLKLQRKYNLQYMLITIAVATVFVLLIVIGMFKVSAFTIRAMGFFSLIFFFEFLILILDNWIHHITHGEPFKVLLIKIGIISIILPVHHFLEHKLIHYLLSRHLITVRGRLSSYNFFRKKKIVPPPVDVIQEINQEVTTDQSQEVGGGQIVPKSR
jgi:tetratricopeptide (TPR) repeat protein